MSEPRENPRLVDALPKAAVKKKWRWNFPVVWVIPLLAVIVAGYLVYDRVREFGPKITIKFKDVSGLKIGQTPIKYRGVTIGEVTAVELTEDQQGALVKVRLRHSAASVAREESIFWIVRPEVGIGNVTGLGTVISGPEIQVLPGSGDDRREFVGLESQPVALDRGGLKIVLRSNRFGSLKPGSPVYYRGIEVGAVQDAQLSGNATAVDIHLFIKQRYANLVRSGSKFWNVSGVDVSAGLFRGVEIKLESLRSLVAGGIAFATPDDSKATPAKTGTVFPLYDGPKKEWLEWAPRIPIPPEQ
jgi:paraquat-inducible protein B